MDVSGISNPSGAPVLNFVLDKSRFDVDMQVELPMYGKAWNFVVQDTMNITLGSDITKAEQLFFRTNTNNGFPTDARIQIYFLNQFNVVLDSLSSPSTMIAAGAPVGPAPGYKVTTPVLTTNETTFNKDKIMKLQGCEKAVVRAYLNTTDANSGQLVKFYSDYTIDIRVGLRAIFDVQY